MAIQHRDIIDSERHEAKGASSASAGQVLQANGDGTTSFINPSLLDNWNIESSLVSQSFADQNPSSVDTPLQVVWGTASNTSVDVASNGVITFLEDGLYYLTFNLNFGRTADSGTVILAVRFLVNGVASGITQKFTMSDSTASVPLCTSDWLSASASDTITAQIIRDSAGINNGGLLSTDITLADWADAPSAAICIQKIAGAS